MYDAMDASTSEPDGGPPLVGDDATRALLQMFASYQDIVAGGNPEVVRSRLGALASSANAHGCLGPAVVPQLGAVVGVMSDRLMDMGAFSVFYRFVFFVSRQPGVKNLDVDVAIRVWKLVLEGRFRLLDRWCDFVRDHHHHTVTEDTWRQVLDFSRIVHEDLSNYDPNGAWPVLVDDFVDRMVAYKAGRGGVGGVGDGDGGSGSGGGGIGAGILICSHDGISPSKLFEGVESIAISPVSGSKRRGGGSRCGDMADMIAVARVEGIAAQLEKMHASDEELGGQLVAPAKRPRWGDPR